MHNFAPVTLRQAFCALDAGRLLGGADEPISSVSTDTRRIRKGCLFIAIKGESFDAHHFLPEAQRRGAAAVMVERWVPGLKLPALMVSNTRKAYGALARAWRLKFDLPLISVAGSNGKTTTKEMIAAILRAHFGEGAYLSTRGNLNNDMGVPQTLLALRARHLAGVVELGTNHPGEIGELAAYACAGVAVITNAQREHQEFLHGVEASAVENGASIAALSPDGVAVYPGDDDCAPIWRALLGERRSIEFGLAEQAGQFHVWATPDASPSQFAVMFGDQAVQVSLNIAGQHNIRNALAAAACTQAIGLPYEAIRKGLEAFRPASGRLETHLLNSGLRVIDDSYNANPDSVRAAVDVLMSLPGPRVMVLGDMGEVGAQGDQYHREVGEYAARQGIHRLYCLGEATRATVLAFNASREVASKSYDDAPHLVQQAEHFAQFEALMNQLKSVQGSLLVKGSRFMKMERVIAAFGITRQTAEGAH